MNQQEKLKKNEKEILKQEDVEMYIQSYKGLIEKRRKKYGIYCFSSVFILGIMVIFVCILGICNVYVACFMFVEMLFLAVILQLLSKKENQKIVNKIKPCGSRKLIFIEMFDEKKSVLEYSYAENQEIKKTVKENIVNLHQLKEGEYATLVELEEGRNFFSNDIDWAVDHTFGGEDNV